MVSSYLSFKELATHEVEDQDYRIRIELRDPRVLIMAPHGGRIEPTTEVIAEAIADHGYSLYIFEGLETDSRPLHIESHLFDEPRALQVVQKADVVITIHGQLNQKEEFVMVGGLNGSLRSGITRELEGAGFQTRVPTEGLMGTDPQNICNRGRLRRGVQLEVSRKVRDLLRTDKNQLQKFANAVRKAVQSFLSNQKH
jgi:phage replication-related protein YjqB (UPF0714/DUF867 family)